MSPEERALLERAVKLGEHNSRELSAVRRHMHWSVLWGFVKFLLIAIPLAWGYFYVKDNLSQPTSWLDQAQSIVDSFR